MDTHTTHGTTPAVHGGVAPLLALLAFACLGRLLIHSPHFARPHNPAAAMVLLPTLLVALIALFVPLVAPATITLQNSYVALNFDNTTFALQSILSNLHTPPYPLTSLTQPNTEWWTATLITNTTAYAISPTSPHASTAAALTHDTLELLWRSVAVGDKSLGYTVDVGVSIVLPSHSPYAEFRYRVMAGSGVLGLWSFTYSLSHLPSAGAETDEDDMFVLNHSYGALYTKPLLTHPTTLTEPYPSGGGAFQFLAHYHAVNTTAFPPTHPGLYVATHDPTGSYKEFRYEPNVAAATITLAIELRPPNNNLPLTARSGVQPFSYVIGCFSGDWWDASQLYRTWSLSEAPWSAHSIRQRGRRYPEVMKRAQVWINTGWQDHDVFNTTQGDPAVVVDRVTHFAAKLNLKPQQLALHWYVFQDSNKFDAYYPVYFPAKDNFTDAVAALQDSGVSVFPYINGRIFDVDLPKWTEDDAQRFAAKSTPAVLGFNLSLYYEDYGNDVEQAAMCPYTEYWQDTYRNVSDVLVHTHGVHGIYIDQIGAAQAQPCYDPSHNHTLGDGTAWVEGYWKFLQGVLDEVGPEVAIVTESNAEPYMSNLHGYLTLTAFALSVQTNDGAFIPVFPSVYGGYMTGFGAIFTVADLVDNTDSGYATILANQFVHGAQLGWMSLGGTQDAPPMGLYELLMSDAYEAEVDWLRRLGVMRAVVTDYFLYGREMRTPPFTANVTYNTPTNTTSDTVPYLSSAWLLQSNQSSSSLLLTLVTPDSTIAKGGLTFALQLSLVDFGVSMSVVKQRWVVWQWHDDGSREILSPVLEGVVTLDGSISGRSMLVLTVERAEVSDSSVAAE